MDRFVGTGLGRKRSGLHLARLIPKPLASRPPRILPEISSGTPLNLPSTGDLEDAPLDTIKGVGMASSGSLGHSLLPETSSHPLLPKPELLLPVALAASPGSVP